MRPRSPAAPSGSSPDAAAVAAPAVSRSFSVSRTLGVIFLASQLIFILQTIFSSDSPHLLTPVEGLTRYEIAATMDGHSIAPDLIRHRYGMPPAGALGLTAEAVESVIAFHERPVPRQRAVLVRLRIQEAGGAPEFWLWPQE